jgi:hypothetical protein
MGKVIGGKTKITYKEIGSQGIIRMTRRMGLENSVGRQAMCIKETMLMTREMAMEK